MALRDQRLKALWDRTEAALRSAPAADASSVLADRDSVLHEIQEDTSEQRTAREQLERLAKFPAENPNPVMRIAADGVVLYSNEASSHLLDAWQCAAGEVLPEAWRSVVSSALAADDARTAEVQCGDVIYALTFAPVTDQGFVNVYGLDVTSLRRATNRAEWLAGFPAENPNPVMRIAPDGTVLYANPASSPLLTLWRRETGGALPDAWRTAVRKALAAAEPQTGTERCGDQTYALVLSPLRDLSSVNVYGLDITRRKRSERERAESEARFRATFEQAAVGIALASPDGLLERVNDRFCDILGTPRAELQTKTFADVTHPDDVAEDVTNLKQLLAGEMAHYSTRKRYVRGDARIVWVNLTVSVARKADGEPHYLIAVVEDITDLRQAQEAAETAREQVLEQQRQGRAHAEAEMARMGDELVRTTRLAAVGQVSASIAHDLRNPLARVSGLWGNVFPQVFSIKELGSGLAMP